MNVARVRVFVCLRAVFVEHRLLVQKYSLYLCVCVLECWCVCVYV